MYDKNIDYFEVLKNRKSNLMVSVLIGISSVFTLIACDGSKQIDSTARNATKPTATTVIEEDKVYEATEIAGVCNQINDASTRIAILAGKDFNVAASSVRFLGARLGGDGTCRYEIDTAIGPKTCPVLGLIKKGGKIIIAASSMQQTLMCGY